MTRPVHYELPKQPTEEVIIPGFDFTDQMDATETISSALVTIKERVTGVDTTSTMKPAGSEQIVEKTVSWRVKLGTHNVDYDCEVVATLSSGRTLSGVVRLGVRDRPY